MRLPRWTPGLFSIVFVIAGCEKPADGVTLDECEDVELFENEPCLESLIQRCQAITTEEDCWAAEPVPVVWYRPYTYCVWMNVMTVADEQTCELGPSVGRCEAATPSLAWDGIEDPCPYVAFVDDFQLVQPRVSSPDGLALYDMILDESSATGCEVEFPHSGLPSPEWCACASAECSVAGD